MSCHSKVEFYCKVTTLSFKLQSFDQQIFGIITIICNRRFGIYQYRTSNIETPCIFIWRDGTSCQGSDKDNNPRQEANTVVSENTEITDVYSEKCQLFAYLMYFEEEIVAKYALFCDCFSRFDK